MIGQHEMEGLSREERTAILRLQMEQIMQAPGQLSRKMDLCVWVNQLDEKDLAALFEQVLPKEDGDMKAERRWEISEIRQYVLTRWARLNPANAMDASMKVFSPMPDAVLEVWIRTDATAVGDALLGLVAKGDWRPQDWEFANYVRELFGTDNVAATDVVMQLSESCDLDSRKLGDASGAEIIYSLAEMGGSGGVLAWIDSVGRDDAQKQVFLKQAVSALAGNHVFGGAMSVFQRLGAARDADTAKVLARELTRWEPQQAQALAMTLPVGEVRAAFVKETVSNLAYMQGVSDTFSWLQSLGNHPDYDGAWRSLAGTCSLETDKRMALACLDAMSPSDNRELLRFTTSMNWLLSGDPAAAQVVSTEYVETATRLKELHRELEKLITGFTCELTFSPKEE